MIRETLPPKKDEHYDIEMNPLHTDEKSCENQQQIQHSSENDETPEEDDDNRINVTPKKSTLNLLGPKRPPLSEVLKKGKVKIPQQTALGQRKLLEFVCICIGANLLAMNAGFMNVITLERSGVVVSHVTGTLTKSALSLELHDFKTFRAFFCVPCFICGSFFSSMLINYQTFYLGRAYNRVFFLGSLLLSLAAFLAIYDGESMRYAYLTAVVCGMQNSMTTEYSGGVLRSTHCTGTATDIGIVLARILKGREGESWKLFVLVPLMCSFFLGGYTGALVYGAAPNFALFTNVIFFGGTGVLYSLYLVIYRHGNFFRTLFCTTDIENLIDPNGAKTRTATIGMNDEEDETKGQEDGYDGNGNDNGNDRDEYDEEEGKTVETEEPFAHETGSISHFIHDDEDDSNGANNQTQNKSRRRRRGSHHREADSIECFSPYDI